jgi:hypothetical protein
MLRGGARLAGGEANSGRTELIVSQATVGPLLLGVFIPAAAQMNEPTAPVLLAFTGLGLGIGGTYALTDRYPVTTGQAMAIGSGEIIGMLNGAAISVALDEQAVWAGLSLGTVLGGGIGVAGAIAADPTAGQMAVVRSGATWGAYVGGVSFTIVDGSGTGEDLVRVALAADVGAISGMILAANYDPGRGRMNLINLSGYAGTLVAGGIVVLAVQGASTPDTSLIGAGLLLGTGAGLGAGIWLTAPKRNGSDVSWSVGGAPRIAFDDDGLRVFAPLAQGRF